MLKNGKTEGCGNGGLISLFLMETSKRLTPKPKLGRMGLVPLSYAAPKVIAGTLLPLNACVLNEGS